MLPDVPKDEAPSASAPTDVQPVSPSWVSRIKQLLTSKLSKKWLLALGVVLVLILGGLYWFYGHNHKVVPNTASSSLAKSSQNTPECRSWVKKIEGDNLANIYRLQCS